MASRRHVAQAAQAVRALARTASDYGRREPVYGAVISTKPLVAQLHGSSLELDADALVLTQSVRRYDRDHTIDVGDTLVVSAMPNGDWLVTDVVSSKDLD